MVGGVGAEVLEHDGEQVLAREAGQHAARIRRHRHRVAVVDHQRLDARAERGRGRVQQRIADGRHVDRARPAAGHQVGTLQRGVVAIGREPTGRRQQHAAGGVAPGAGQARQQRHQPHRVAAAGRPLHAVVGADRRRPRHAPVARQLADVLHRHAAHLRGALRRPRQRLFAQTIRAFHAVDMAGHIVFVDPAVHEQLVHQRQRQRAVAAGAQRQVAVALVGGLGAAGVDAPQLGAVALGLLREAPEVQVRRDRVAAPDDDEAAAREVFKVHAKLAAERGLQRGAAGRGADGAVEPRGAEAVEEARGHAFALHEAHRAGIAVRHDRLRLARRDRTQALGDDVQRIVPADALEAARALGADAAQRMQHALGMLDALGIARHLRAQRAMRRRVRRVALDADDAAALHADADRAGVGAVMRAGGVDDGGRGHGQILTARGQA